MIVGQNGYAIAVLQRIAWGAGGPDRYDVISACNKAIAALLKESLAMGRKTNADRIRQMSDEELAKYLGTELDGCVGRKCVIDDNTDCQKCWLDWLKQEVESNEASEILRNRKPRWISVEDRLPEESANYLTYGVFLPLGVKAMDLCRFNGNGWMIDQNVKITHWMPLPEPPTTTE